MNKFLLMARVASPLVIKAATNIAYTVAESLIEEGYESTRDKVYNSAVDATANIIIKVKKSRTNNV